MSGSSVSLDYTQDGDVLFQLSAPVSGCHASLGAFPHWCLGNVSACDTSGFSLGFWFKLQTSDVTSNDVILLTNGGTTPNSDGFYILRRYGDQIEIGVAKGGNLWRETLRLRTDDVWSHMTVRWMAGTGLTVGVDGVRWLSDVSPSARGFVTAADVHEIESGLDGFGRPMTSPCSFSVKHVQMTNSAADAVTFTQEQGVLLLLFCLFVCLYYTITHAPQITINHSRKTITGLGFKPTTFRSI